MAYTFFSSAMAGFFMAYAVSSQADIATGQYAALSGTTVYAGLNRQSSSSTTLASKPASNRVMKSTNRPAGKNQTSGSGISALAELINKRKQKASKREAGTSSQALISDDQQVALSQLASQNSDPQGLRAYFDRSNGTPSFLKMKVDMAAGIAARDANLRQNLVRGFLREQAELMKIDNPDEEFSLQQTLLDQQGNSHFRLQQLFQGVPVWGSQVMVHLNDSNQVYLLNGRYQPSISSVDSTASLSAQQAVDVALQDLGVTRADESRQELVVFTDEQGVPHLSWKLRMRLGLGQSWLYFIDAQTGEQLHRLNMIQHAGSVVSASGSDDQSVSRNFSAWSESGTFFMIDPTFPLDDPEHDPLNETKSKGDTYVLDVQNGDGSSMFYSTSNSSNSGWDPTAVSAMANTRVVYDYYKNTFGRDGIDGQNKNFLLAIHFDEDYNNAFWNGTYMVFGDGDNQTFSSLAGCLDVTAHEMSHGVIETTAALKYENQSGALNESFADIFGAMVDRDDWNMGEDCTVANPGYLRNMRQPGLGLSSQPSKMSEYQNLPNTSEGDNGGVHINSGIPNRAAYLIAEGLTEEGLGTSIGKSATEQIFYKALTEHLTASSQFIDARRATIQSAEELYDSGSAEAIAVAAGWDAVEVVEGSSVPDQTKPTETQAVSGDDLMVYLYPDDGSHDYVDTDADGKDSYAVFAQTLSDPLVYDESKDVYLQNLDSGFSMSAYPSSRPAVYTDEIGTLVFFVGADFNLYRIDLNDLSQEKVTDTSDVWSIAISPDGGYAAYTTPYVSDNTIHVIDIVNGGEAEYVIEPKDYQSGTNGNLQSFQYADALSFDYTGSTLVFDALNCLSTENSSCDDGAGYRYWTIGMMEVSNGDLVYPFPDQSPDYDLAYPSFAQNNNFVIAFDYLDFSSYSSAGEIYYQVLTVDFEEQQIQTVVNFGAVPNTFYATPSFWGDDDALAVQTPTFTSPASTYAVKAGLDDNWMSTGSYETMNEYAVAFPIMHRAAVRELTGRLEAAANSVNFGDVQSGETLTQTLTLSNPGNSDINITGISISGNNADRFAHNATNILLPQQTSMTIAVAFDAGDQAGTKTATLNFTTSNSSDVAVSLLANTLSDSGTGSGSSGGGGGGGSLPMFLLMLFGLLLLIPGWRRIPEITD